MLFYNLDQREKNNLQSADFYTTQNLLVSTFAEFTEHIITWHDKK